MNRFLLALLLIGTSYAFAQSDPKDPGCLDSLHIPTSFTPNGDTVHDYFSIEFPCPTEKFVITILNRWGEVIYTSKDYQFKWRGEDTRGNMVSTDVFHYTVEFTYLGEKKKITGQLTVLM